MFWVFIFDRNQKNAVLKHFDFVNVKILYSFITTNHKFQESLDLDLNWIPQPLDSTCRSRIEWPASFASTLDTKGYFKFKTKSIMRFREKHQIWIPNFVACHENPSLCACFDQARDFEQNFSSTTYVGVAGICILEHTEARQAGQTSSSRHMVNESCPNLLDCINFDAVLCWPNIRGQRLRERGFSSRNLWPSLLESRVENIVRKENSTKCFFPPLSL